MNCMFILILISKMSIVPTVFIPTSSENFQGFGINSITDFGVTLTNYINCLTLNWARLHIKSSDPGDSGIYFDDAGFDNLWLTSNDLVTGKSRFSFSSLQAAQANIIFTMGADPTSFLSNNGRNELTGSRLLAYARYWASAVKIHADLGMVVEWVDLCENLEICSGGATYITPGNYVLLIDNFKQILASRGITNVKVMGPNIQLFTLAEFTNPYIDVFLGTSVLDAWSFHCIEKKPDLALYNSGTFDSRKYVYDRASTLTQQMRIILPGIPIYCTKFTTYATKYSFGVDYGPVASEMAEFGIRLSDNLCGLLSAGVSSVIFWFIYKKFDHFSLHRNNGSKRPQRDAIEMITKNITFLGNTYYHLNTNFPSGDETMKGTVVEGNGFNVVLSRAILNDPYLKQVSVEIDSLGMWNATSYNITLAFVAFPLYVDTSGIQYTTSILNGILTFQLTQVPYNCVVFVKGALYETFTQAPPVQYANFNIPKVSALPITADEGDVVYYVVDNKLYTFINNVWVQSQLFGP
jgi:hypothetical protein